MANLTIQQYIAKLKRQRSQLSTTKAVFVAASTAHADQVERIFTHGGATSGANIGYYESKNGIYINPEDSPKSFTTKGKGQKRAKTTEVFDIATRKSRRQSIKNDFSERKTKYFDSYKAFRQAMGLETAFVNLDLTGRLKLEYENSLQRIDDFMFEARFRTKLSEDKATGNQKRFDKVIFAASKEERKTFRDTFRFEINRILNA